MGNCQAVDAAALVIQHPDGRLDRLYWPTSASEVMKTNPGHYVTLIIPLPAISSSQEDVIKKPASGRTEEGDGAEKKKMIRFTRVKLLRPTDTLVLGRAYRLVTTQEVMEVLRAKKIAKMKKKEMDSKANDQKETKTERRSFGDRGGSRRTDMEKMNNQEAKEDKGRAVGRSRSWRPSLQSISESTTRD
ncbi:hypothetical protein Droror1_Dr00018544 [Drosera rotundifolia]